MQIVFTVALASLSRFSTLSSLLLSSAADALALHTLRASCRMGGFDDMIAQHSTTWHARSLPRPSC